MKERRKREGVGADAPDGVVRRLRGAGFACEAERGVGDQSAKSDVVGVQVEGEGGASGLAESVAAPVAAAVLAAGAPEARRAAEAERGIGDKAKAEMMRKRSKARASQ